MGNEDDSVQAMDRVTMSVAAYYPINVITNIARAERYINGDQEAPPAP
jgi:hypothetical protein